MSESAKARIINYLNTFEVVAKPSTPDAPATKPKPKKKAKRKLTKYQVNRWNLYSRKAQREYLKKHPHSIYHSVGVKKSVRKSTSTMTAGEQKKVRKRIKKLSADGAMEPGSMERSQSAALIEKSSSDIIKENVPQEELASITKDLNDVASGKVPVYAVGDEADSDKNKPNSKSKDGTDSTEKKPTSKLKKAAYLLGAIGVAALIGGSVFAVNPAMGAYFGYVFLEKMPDIMQTIMNHESLSSEDNEHNMEKFLALLADYIRQGDLPEDLLAKLQKEYGDE